MEQEVGIGWIEGVHPDTADRHRGVLTIGRVTRQQRAFHSHRLWDKRKNSLHSLGKCRIQGDIGTREGNIYCPLLNATSCANILKLGVRTLQMNYSGTMTALSFGIASYTALSMFRCAITSSGGVCESHSESDRSWYRSDLNISRNRKSVSPVFSM